MPKRSHKIGRAGKPRASRTKPLPVVGDLGTGTTAATADTEVVLLPDPNPNRLARRMRITALDRLDRRGSLSMRQMQAARAIEAAYCRVQMLSSGGEFKAKVDSTPRPDATVAAQVDANSRLVLVMSAVPPAMRDVVETVCWHSLPVESAQTEARNYRRMADLKVALDLVANRMRY